MRSTSYKELADLEVVRERCGLLQSDVASMLDISPQSYSRLMAQLNSKGPHALGYDLDIAVQKVRN